MLMMMTETHVRDEKTKGPARRPAVADVAQSRADTLVAFARRLSHIGLADSRPAVENIQNGLGIRKIICTKTGCILFLNLNLEVRIF